MSEDFRWCPFARDYAHGGGANRLRATVGGLSWPASCSLHRTALRRLALSGDVRRRKATRSLWTDDDDDGAAATRPAALVLAVPRPGRPKRRRLKLQATVSSEIVERKEFKV